MADKILLRAGNKANIPTLQYREVAYCLDENAIYMGAAGGNKKVGEELEEKVEALKKAVSELQDDISGKLTATPADAQDTVAADADAAAIASALNSLIAAMKACGLMKT